MTGRPDLQFVVGRLMAHIAKPLGKRLVQLKQCTSYRRVTLCVVF